MAAAQKGGQLPPLPPPPLDPPLEIDILRETKIMKRELDKVKWKRNNEN